MLIESLETRRLMSGDASGGMDPGEPEEQFGDTIVRFSDNGEHVGQDGIKVFHVADGHAAFGLGTAGL